MDNEITYRKILKCSNNAQIRNLGRYLDKAKYKQFQKQNNSKRHKHEMMEAYHCDNPGFISR
jgi:hypothetical protein